MGLHTIHSSPANTAGNAAAEEVLRSPERLLEIYYYLLLTRMLENKVAYICHNQNPQQPIIIGKGYLSTGQEGISVGAAYALESGDWLAQIGRAHV